MEKKMPALVKWSTHSSDIDVRRSLVGFGFVLFFFWSDCCCYMRSYLVRRVCGWFFFFISSQFEIWKNILFVISGEFKAGVFWVDR